MERSGMQTHEYGGCVEDSIKIEKKVAKAYIHKIDNARKRGLDFDLTIAEFKRVYLRKNCAYSGFEMTLLSEDLPLTDERIWYSRTIERIDSSLGYVKGNCVAVCSGVNSMKSQFEDPAKILTVLDAIKIFKNIDKLLKR